MIFGVCIIFILLFWGYTLSVKPQMYKSNIVTELSTKVTILIAFRNEEKHLEELLEAFTNQKGICKEDTQLIFIDDHSDDNGCEIIKNWQLETKYNTSLVKLTDGHGKKAALRYGSSYAKHDILLFTDADCTPSKYWVNQMVYVFENTKADLLIGTVWYKESVIWFKRLQALEFAVLQSITAISVQANWPFMCNGANLMTHKSSYLKYLNLEYTQGIVSGDDVFYLDYLIQNNKYIKYVNSTFAYVETDAEAGLTGFIQQRLRWSSKVKYYKNWKMILPSMLFTVWSLSIYLPLIMALWYPDWMCGLLIVLKLCIDYIVVNRFYKDFDREFKLIDFVVLTVVYPIYVIYIGTTSFFKTFTWKKRQAKV